MKRINTFLFKLASLSAIIAILVACSDGLNSAPETQQTSRITIQVDNTGRTVLPNTPVFSYYTFTFSSQDGQDEQTLDTNDSTAEIDLALGTWDITAVGYVHISGIAGITNGYYKAAKGSETIEVTDTAPMTISIDLRSGVEAGAKGILSYSLILPEDATSAGLKIMDMTGTTIKTLNLKMQSSGTEVLEAGYYLVSAEVTTPNLGKIVKTEVVHIYGGLTSELERDLRTLLVFTPTSSIESVLSYLDMLPANTQDTPIQITLEDVDVSDLESLFSGLDRYISLDLSGSTGTSISFNGYANADKLVSLVLPVSLTSITGWAFGNCSSLISIDLSATSITSIGDQAFIGTSLVSIELPLTVTSIAGMAFSNVASLVTVISRASTPPTLGSYVFMGTSDSLVIYVPVSSVDAYKSSWGGFAGSGLWDMEDRIQTIPE